MITTPLSRNGASHLQITDAVLLMAGAGSRLATTSANVIPKPLLPIGGRPLVSYTLDAFATAGVHKVHAVLGANSDLLVAGLRRLLPAGISLNIIRNPEWQKQNGVSVLCVAPHVEAPFFLAMGDHLFEPAILRTLVGRAKLGFTNLAIDRKIGTVFDLADAMKVETRGDRVVAISKELTRYDAIDTGVFLCGTEIFPYLRRARVHGDCSLADGLRLMAADRNVAAINIGDAWWQDVDTPEMLRHAETQCARLVAPVA